MTKMASKVRKHYAKYGMDVVTNAAVVAAEAGNESFTDKFGVTWNTREYLAMIIADMGR
jgi:hypothetical protein